MGAMTTRENGVSVLLPYAMPYTLDENGEREDYGRYTIAYSRDGWFVLDVECSKILFWAVSEEDAVQRRNEVLNGA